MTAPTLEKPGVEVIQEFVSTSPTILLPTLVPCVIGPCFQIIEAFDSSGQVNADAIVGQRDPTTGSVTPTYYVNEEDTANPGQWEPTVFNLSELPNPRNNYDELDIDLDSLRLFLVTGSQTEEVLDYESLLRRRGDADGNDDSPAVCVDDGDNDVWTPRISVAGANFGDTTALQVPEEFPHPAGTGEGFVEPGDRIVLNGTSYTITATAVSDPTAGLAGNELLVTPEIQSDPSGAATQFDNWYIIANLNTSSSNPAARPSPDVEVDSLAGTVTIKGGRLRNPVSAEFYTPMQATILAPYKALRLDVSALAENTSVLPLIIEDTTMLSDLISPISPDNPLAFAAFFALLNAPGVSIAALGVDEVTADAPDGTLDAYVRAFELLEAREVYALAPLTHDPTTHQAAQAHVNAMSVSTVKHERIVLINPERPTRANNVTVASGTQGNTDPTSGGAAFVTGVNIAQALLDLGINPLAGSTPGTGFADISSQNYLQIFLDVEGDDNNYRVTKVDTNKIWVTDSPEPTVDNPDGFFVTSYLPALVDVNWSLQIRGSKLELPNGSPDKSLIAETLAGQAETYGDRRVLLVVPDVVTANVEGIESNIDGYYLCAAIAGMIGQQAPQQGFTNLPIAGFLGVRGSNDSYNETQLSVLCGGGCYVVVQPTPGAALSSRHQLTTDLSSIEKRELSITKAVDYISKFIRVALRPFIGRFNINKQLLDSVSTVLQGLLKYLVERKIVNTADLVSLEQSEDQPDTILATIDLGPAYPCNYIRVTLQI